jgi:hypothetical protein
MAQPACSIVIAGIILTHSSIPYFIGGLTNCRRQIIFFGLSAAAIKCKQNKQV